MGFDIDQAASASQPRAEWLKEFVGSDGLFTRGFRIYYGGRTVPAVLWTNQKPGPKPLVLLCHGGSQHKASDEMVARAVQVLGHLDCVVAAIDGPIHGERREKLEVGPGRQAEFLTMWRNDPLIDYVVDDWKAALDVLLQLDDVDPSRVAWYGVSMGTAYGVPLLAKEPRIGAAVLGMWGADYTNSERIRSDACSVSCPVLFQQKWDDSLFTRAGQIELFDLLGNHQKWLNVYPGTHTIVSRMVDDAALFLSEQLRDVSRP